MVRVASGRIAHLFALAERESATGHPELADRYVRLARAIGMRYTVRLPPEYRELYCRRCSSYWAEGRTVRTRLRSGHRVRTCLVCGHARRTIAGGRRFRTSTRRITREPEASRDEEALAASKDPGHDEPELVEGADQED